MCKISNPKKQNNMENRKKIDINSEEFKSQLASYLNGGEANLNMVFGVIHEECTRMSGLVMGKMGVRSICKEDLVQEICTKLFDGSLVTYNSSKGTFSGWLYTVIRNHILTEFRKGKNAPEESYDAMGEVERDTLIDSVVDGDNDSDTYKSRIDAIIDCLGILTPYERTVIEGILQNPESVKALAEELGRDGNWVSGVKMRAVEKLKKEIRRRGLME